MTWLLFKPLVHFDHGRWSHGLFCNQPLGVLGLGEGEGEREPSLPQIRRLTFIRFFVGLPPPLPPPVSMGLEVFLRGVGTSKWLVSFWLPFGFLPV